MRGKGALISIPLLMAFGCEQEIDRPMAVPLDQVPPNVMKAATDAQPGLRFTSALRGLDHGQDVYEVRGKTKEGKILEVEVTPAGKVVRVE